MTDEMLALLASDPRLAILFGQEETIETDPLEPLEEDPALPVFPTGIQRGNGRLKIQASPVVTELPDGVRQAVWTTSEILTCTGGRGGNLKVKGFQFTVWSDGRWAFASPCYANESGFSNWIVKLSVLAAYSTKKVVPSTGTTIGTYVSCHGTKIKDKLYLGNNKGLSERFNEIIDPVKTYLFFAIDAERTYRCG